MSFCAAALELRHRGHANEEIEDPEPGRGQREDASVATEIVDVALLKGRRV